MLNRNLERIIAASYIQLGDNALRLARNHKNGMEGSKRQEALWNESASVRILLKGLESRDRQEYTTVNKLLSCLVKLSNINDYPAAPVLYNSIKPSVVLPQGIQGDTGQAGNDGDDANINVVEGDDTIQIVETAPGGVRTFTVSYAPYTTPSIDTAINTGALSPSSRYRETGDSISVDLVITVTKGREDVDTSTVTSPGALDVPYQLIFDETVVNANGSQVIPLTDLSVTASTTYTVIVDDVATPTPGTDSDTDNIYFNYPILYGNSTSTTPDHYAVLTKKTRTDGGIQPQQTTSVNFNATGNYFYFTYHTSYGDLSSIKDQNGFEVLAVAVPSFVKANPDVSVTSTGLTANWTEDFIEYRTTALTNINGTYTFTW